MKALFLDLDNTIFDSKGAYDFALSRLSVRYGSYFRGIPFLEEFERHKKDVKARLKGHPGNRNRLLVLKRMADLYWDGLDAEKLLFLEKNYFKYFKKNVVDQLRLHRKGYKRLFSILDRYSNRIPIYILTNESLRTQLYKISWVFPSHIKIRLISSEEVGFEKPSQDFYSYAMSRVGASPSEVVMIGDSLEDDILGALASNIKAYHLTSIFGEEIISDETLGNKKFFKTTNLAYTLETIWKEEFPEESIFL